MKKNERISKIANFIPPQQFVADIGCDHGYLIIEAFKNHYIKKAQAIDNKEGPLTSAIKNLQNTKYFNQVEFCLSSGLEKLNPNVDVVVMAGMGGLLIAELLFKGSDKINNQKLILQANKHVHELRTFLWEQSFEIIEEEIIFEGEKYYEILIARKSLTKQPYIESDLMFGPINLKRREEVFLKKLNIELEHIRTFATKTKIMSEKEKKIMEVLNEN